MRIKTVLAWMFVFLYASWAGATSSVEGRWTTIDDKTGEKRAVIYLFTKENTLYGVIEKVYPRPGDTGICSECPGEFKDKPIHGLQIVWGLKEKSDGSWDDGHILDAKSGKIYRTQMSVKNEQLSVRGYVGIPMLGRTQLWVRE